MEKRTRNLIFFGLFDLFRVVSRILDLGVSIVMEVAQNGRFTMVYNGKSQSKIRVMTGGTPMTIL